MVGRRSAVARKGAGCCIPPNPGIAGYKAAVASKSAVVDESAGEERRQKEIEKAEAEIELRAAGAG